MKKISFKNKSKPKDKKTEKEKLEERREEVLSQGRKFKYPLQYAKHTIVLWTVLIAVFAAVVLSGVGYFALYKLQNTSDLFYRLTQIIPVPVATVDGTNALYSDYLMVYKSSIKPLEQQKQLGDDENAQKMKEHYKRAALTEVENYTYALKVGKELGVEVSNKEVDQAIAKHRKAGGLDRSNESFEKVLNDNFGLTKKEYRRLIYLGLMKAKVAQAIDEVADKTVQEVEKRLASEKDLEKIAKAMEKKVSYEQTGGIVDKMNIDGGRAMEAMKLKEGEVSKKLLSSGGDSYYFVKLQRKDKNGVDYVSLKISLNELNNRIKKLRDSGKIQEKITLEEDKS